MFAKGSLGKYLGFDRPFNILLGLGLIEDCVNIPFSQCLVCGREVGHVDGI